MKSEISWEPVKEKNESITSKRGFLSGPLSSVPDKLMGVDGAGRGDLVHIIPL